MTSLSLAIKGEAETELQHRAYFDLENEQFYLGETTKTVTRRIEAFGPLLVPLSDVLFVNSQDGDRELLKAVERIILSLREQSKFGNTNRNEAIYGERLHRLGTMLTRHALCEEFTDDHEEDAFELFSRLNKGGTSLSVLLCQSYMAAASAHDLRQ